MRSQTSVSWQNQYLNRINITRNRDIYNINTRLMYMFEGLNRKNRTMSKKKGSFSHRFAGEGFS